VAAAALECKSCATLPSSRERHGHVPTAAKRHLPTSASTWSGTWKVRDTSRSKVLCDDHGQAVALGERECSVQRRHQKIIEESPSPAGFFTGDAGSARRRALHQAALDVVTAVGYRGAGTVEFVANAAGELFFLESMHGSRSTIR
jgi:hypothetical protein